jgi:hypothetical protein
MLVEMVGFAAPKSSNSPAEWEDGARFDECWRPGTARVVVADGATEAFDVIRWVGQLVTSFVPAIGDPSGAPPPQIDPDSMAAWVDRMQRQWAAESPREFGTYFEAEKFRISGTFATFLGCELVGLDGRAEVPHWRAVAVGDTVLFQVRDGQLLRNFPPLSADDFDNHPDLVHSDPRWLDQVIGAFRFESGEIQCGDLLFVATDALAHWLLEMCAGGASELWTLLSGIDEPGFVRLVDEQRASGALKDDDVTLVRTRVVQTPSAVLVCP